MSALLQNCPQMRVGHDTLFMAGSYRVFLPYSIVKRVTLVVKRTPQSTDWLYHRTQNMAIADLLIQE